jgi:hypothetical protein
MVEQNTCYSNVTTRNFLDLDEFNSRLERLAEDQDLSRLLLRIEQQRSLLTPSRMVEDDLRSSSFTPQTSRAKRARIDESAPTQPMWQETPVPTRTMEPEWDGMDLDARPED